MRSRGLMGALAVAALGAGVFAAGRTAGEQLAEPTIPPPPGQPKTRRTRSRIYRSPRSFSLISPAFNEQARANAQAKRERKNAKRLANRSRTE